MGYLIMKTTEKAYQISDGAGKVCWMPKTVANIPDLKEGMVVELSEKGKWFKGKAEWKAADDDSKLAKTESKNGFGTIDTKPKADNLEIAAIKSTISKMFDAIWENFTDNDKVAFSAKFAAEIAVYQKWMGE